MKTGYRKKRIRRFIILILFCVITTYILKDDLLFLRDESQDKDYNETEYVKRVIDGDTIELMNGEMVRYIGIDTPELRKKQDGKWIYLPDPFGKEAEEFNKRLVQNKRVRIEYDIQRRDKYNRLLAYIYVDDLFVNAEMVKEGYAMVYFIPPNKRYSVLFMNLQKKAKRHKKGIWSVK